ncbi:RNA-directed DNA polymerase [Aeromicrobium sp. 179-A 4D2 NHS]|uniref:RNA-directed DNA polymerase n=1 Tax=Aeromicrobium sp. 179-A 4D2 NHS TaxID=3142375 RepID=UPI00399FFA22
MDWSKALDVDVALKNVRQDLVGDWYRDPWGWPEIEYVATSAPAVLFDRAASSGVYRVANLDVPKEGFASRPAVVMEPVDRLLYQAVVDRVSVRLTKGMQPWVFGWRLRRRKPAPGLMARNDYEWANQRNALYRLVEKQAFDLKTDIVSCFASMPIHRVIEDIEHRVDGQHAVVGRLTGMLHGWDAAPGRRGLPQRNAASSLLANMYLMNLDEAVTDYNETTRRSTSSSRKLSTRWMDDLWVFGHDEGRLRRLQVDLQDKARNLGLELHAAKTGIHEGDELARQALQTAHSAVDSALNEPLFSNDSPDTAPLRELVESLLEEPEAADRSSVHFACVRLRQKKMTAEAQLLLEQAERMPHVADHLSRLSNDLGLWKSYQTWYADYVKSDWARFSWSVAQLTTMFPSKSKVSDAVVTALVELMDDKPDLPVLAVGIQRLARWDSDTAKDLLRALESKSDHPLERRLLALGSLDLREPRHRIRDLLGAYPENQVTLRLIEDRGFKKLAAAKDFR